MTTDGTIQCEGYIYYECCRFARVDFVHFTTRELGDGSWKEHVRTINGPVGPGDAALLGDYGWRKPQPITPER